MDGFHGISIEYMRSPKFLQVDGGWKRIVWMPASIKKRVNDFIPKDMGDKIATENEAKTIDELKVFLEKMEHPVVERWKAVPAEVPPEAEEEVAAVPPEISLREVPIATGGYMIILKEPKIYAKKVIVRKVEK